MREKGTMGERGRRGRMLRLAPGIKGDPLPNRVPLLFFDHDDDDDENDGRLDASLKVRNAVDIQGAPFLTCKFVHRPLGLLSLRTLELGAFRLLDARGRRRRTMASRLRRLGRHGEPYGWVSRPHERGAGCASFRIQSLHH